MYIEKQIQEKKLQLHQTQICQRYLQGIINIAIDVHLKLKHCFWMNQVPWLPRLLVQIGGIVLRRKLQWMVQPRISTAHIKMYYLLVSIIKTKFFYEFRKSLRTWSSHALSSLKITAAPKLLAGLIPVPVIGMVAKCTMNTANPMGRGANTYKYIH